MIPFFPLSGLLLLVHLSINIGIMLYRWFDSGWYAVTGENLPLGAFIRKGFLTEAGDTPLRRFLAYGVPFVCLILILVANGVYITLGSIIGANFFTVGSLFMAYVHYH